ncbi:hypothetical protein B0H16DRAFT_1742277 [Mycena metata]|uniref:Uncharacterized protein n=1 Tax=Mycena metata TaxID=1033252 RepID=A0AAD7MFN1_9AGAR|nr:hypothetical protein B0H16DRAFT_1742277 [Mycena metata]
MPPKNRCQPRYFPQPGHKNTVIHDGCKDGRYFVVGAGHCGNGVFTDANIANTQTDGFSGYVKRSAKRWTGVGGVKDIWASFCDQLHQDGCHNDGRLPDGWNAATPVACNCPAPAATAAPAPAPTAPAPPRRRACTCASRRRLAIPNTAPTQNQRIWPVPRVPALRTLERIAEPASCSAALPAHPTHDVQRATHARTLEPIRWGAIRWKLVDGERDGLYIGLRVIGVLLSSPAASEHDTNYFYDSDSDTDGGDERLQTRFWAVRGLDTIFSGEEEAFDALRQNMGCLKYMQLLSSTSVAKLDRFKRK